MPALWNKDREEDKGPVLFDVYLYIGAQCFRDRIYLHHLDEMRADLVELEVESDDDLFIVMIYHSACVTEGKVLFVEAVGVATALAVGTPVILNAAKVDYFRVEKTEVKKVTA